MRLLSRICVLTFREDKKLRRGACLLETNEIIIENAQDIIQVKEDLIRLIEDAINKTLEVENFSVAVEVSVIFVDNSQIKELNRTHRGLDKETDVLSFPMIDFNEKNAMSGDIPKGDYNYDGEALLLGDIVISLEKAKTQAEEYGHLFEREVGFLTVHSMLHLFGYDHMNEADGKIMREKEEKTLKRMSLVR